MKLWRRQKPVPAARELRDQWLAWLALSGTREATITGYRRITERFLERWPELAMHEFTDDLITGYIEEANPASRQQRRSPFANWFGWAHRTKRITFNVMHHVPQYKQPPQEPTEQFTDAEVKVLCALPEPDGTLMEVLFGTGIRKAEARHLTVKRIDFENAELHIVEGAKGGSVGVVPIPAHLSHRLAAYVLLEGLGDDDFLWYCHPGGTKIRRHDRAIAPGAMHNWWVRCVEASGLRYRNLHCTRHTFAAGWRRRGLTYDDLGFVLRHADPRTTKRVYAHTALFDVRKRMEEMADVK